MGVTVPQQLREMIARADDDKVSLDEMSLAGNMSAALGGNPSLSPDERKGAFAEIEALRFQRPLGAARGTWGIYWSELASGTTKDGRAFYTPDIAVVDEEIISHWIKRSETAKHPVLQARFSDLAWEIGRYLKRSKPSPQGLSFPRFFVFQPIGIMPPISSHVEH